MFAYYVKKPFRSARKNPEIGPVRGVSSSPLMGAVILTRICKNTPAFGLF